jgi:PadR family transcriptional regulator, regulatory protein PadR
VADHGQVLDITKYLPLTTSVPPIETQLLKGVLTLLLLRLLTDDEDYGYAIVVRLHEQGFGDLGEGTVYPALTRLEARGWLSSRLVPSASGPARKYYRLTAEGAVERDRLAAAWHELVTNVNQVLGGSP